jgi:hypothetical protein
MRDRDVRDAVLRHLNNRYADDGETRIVEEMGVWSGTVRIDIAVINGELWGYELKSERDTLERLPAQAALYSRVFDRVTLVTGARHVGHAEDSIPSWWGLIIAHGEAGKLRLWDARRAKRNPALDPYLVAQLLWKEEALAVLERFDRAKGWRVKPIKLVHQRLATELPLPELARQVRLMLKKRDDWLRQKVPYQFDVPVDTNGNPGFQVSRPLNGGGDIVDCGIRPAMPKRHSISVRSNLTRVTN